MSWNHGGTFFESYWQDASRLQKRSLGESASETKPGGTPIGPHTNDSLSDGQMAVALDKDLLDLIESINNELSRTTTNATDRVSPSGSARGSFIDLDNDSAPKTQSNSIFLGRPSSSFRLDVPAIPEGYNEDGLSPNSINSDIRNGIAEENWSRPPVYKGPKAALRSGIAPAPTITTDEPLPQVLHALDDEDDDRIVVVRRITKLGFKSNRIIKASFNRLGWEIKNVILLPSRARSIYSDSTQIPKNHISVSHARPSSMGFVVFRTKKAADECIKRRTVNVDGIEVLVQPFVRQYRPSADSPSHGKLLLST